MLIVSQKVHELVNRFFGSGISQCFFLQHAMFVGEERLFILDVYQTMDLFYIR